MKAYLGLWPLFAFWSVSSVLCKSLTCKELADRVKSGDQDITEDELPTDLESKSLGNLELCRDCSCIIQHHIGVKDGIN